MVNQFTRVALNTDLLGIGGIRSDKQSSKDGKDGKEGKDDIASMPDSGVWV